MNLCCKKTIIENKIYFIRMADYTNKINNHLQN